MAHQAVQGDVNEHDVSVEGETLEEVKRRYAALRKFRSEDHQATLNELNELKARGSSSTKTEEPDFTDEDLADLGESERKIVTSLQARLVAQEEALRAQGASSRAAFFGQLDRTAKGWRSLNDDAAFLNWLSQFDPIIGRTRKQLFDAHVAELDASGAATFFNDYSEQLGQAATAPVSTEPGSVPADPAAAGMEEVWSPQEVAEHYRELDNLSRDRTFRVGHPRYEEVMTRDSKISRARAENRIR